MYEKVSIISAFNNFVKAFTIPSQRLMNDNLHRKMLVSQLQKFLNSNLMYFVKPQPQIIKIPELLPLKQEDVPESTTESTPIVDNITYEVSYNSEEDSIPSEEDPEEIMSLLY
jgi:hypothetical protein